MKKLLYCISLIASPFFANAQDDLIYYEVSFPNAIHHEAQVNMVISSNTLSTLKFRMSRSSPGRYATHEFGKNIYHVKAVDAGGKELEVKQLEGDVYEVQNARKYIKVSYTLFGNWVDGTYLAIDENHAHLNIPAAFAYPSGKDKTPRTVKINIPEGKNWKVSTQLKRQQDDLFTAPNFQYFMDSPIEVADTKNASFDFKNPDGTVQTIHLISHAIDDQQTVDNYASMLQKMVAEHSAVWGELPKFDHGNYYFLHDVYPAYAGDGMEHRNSTVIVQKTPKIAGNETNLLGTFSHEFFHAWNVERLRPKTLEPFNFEHANMSDGLWLAEGFTQYYGNLLLTRAGLKSEDNLIQTLNGIVNTVVNSPGSKDFSPVDASKYAVFADAGVSIDVTNKANIFTSYYTYGASVALALDLRLRTDFKLTLDHYMRALWAAHGKPEIPYTIPDLEKVLAQLTKDPKFDSNFFKNYVYGTSKENFADLLLNAGLVLQKASPNTAHTGLNRLTFENGKALTGPTLKGTPAYMAGLDIDCILLTMDGVDIKDQAALNKVTDAHRPGDTVNITYSYHGKERTVPFTFGENPSFILLSIEKTGGTLTPQMLAFRNQWLKTQVK